MSSEAGEESDAGRRKAKEISVLVGSGHDEESSKLEHARLRLVADTELERVSSCVAADDEEVRVLLDVRDESKRVGQVGAADNPAVARVAEVGRSGAM